MDEASRKAILSDLQEQRATLLDVMSGPRGWTDEHMQKLAHTQMAIAAVEAHGSMRLTTQQRLILLNQYRIMAKLMPEDSSYYDKFAGIVERGYEGLYSELTEWLYDPLSEDDCDEVLRFLDMFRAITFSAQRLKIEIPRGAKFDGFDGNHERQFGFAKFFIERIGRYDELRGGSLNSHSPRLPKYRAMFQAWKVMGQPLHLTEAQIKALADLH